MIPTRALVLLVAVPLGLALLAVAVPGALVPMLAVDLLLVVVAGLDALACRGGVDVGREVAPVQAVGRPFPVVLGIRSTSRRTLSLRVVDDAPGEAEGLPSAITLAPEGSARIRYTLRVDRRGARHFGPITVRIRSPLGLWERQVRHDVADTLRVYPDFGHLRRYGLRAPRGERRVPVRSRRRPGGENEFERLRPYVPGDPYRHIDWRATARRGEFVARQFGQESNQNLVFLLDCGRMTSARSGRMVAFDHALNAAVTLGQVALRHGDRVGLLAFDDRIRAWLPPKGGVRSGGRLVRATYDLFPSLREPDYGLAFRHLAQRVRQRSLVVLVTSVVDEVNADLASGLVGALAPRHLPLCVWMRDPDVEALLTAEPDPYVRGAAAELIGWRERALAGLRRKGALVIDCAPDAITPDLLGRYLEVKTRRLL